jgi:succinylarginine dihydrolase
VNTVVLYGGFGGRFDQVIAHLNALHTVNNRFVLDASVPSSPHIAGSGAAWHTVLCQFRARGHVQRWQFG